MNRALMVAVALLAALGTHADSWSMPEVKTVHSSDGRWRLTVTPKPLKGQLEYFTDKVEGVATAGTARAELHHKSKDRWRRVARWGLVNEVAPVSALVANDGTVVTFDNWHLMGYGDDVVVIYRPDGTLVRKLGLTDLLEEEDISRLSHSVSSIWWSGTHRLDEEKRVLLLEIKAAKPESLPVSLDTGAMLVPKRRMFSPLQPPRVTWTAEDAAACEGGLALPAAELSSHALVSDVPEYPPIARKAKIAGVVIVELRIAPSGAVERAEVVKPLPFGIDKAAHDSVMKWRFRPMEREACGRVRMTFELAD